jgi:hypothetical protein
MSAEEVVTANVVMNDPVMKKEEKSGRSESVQKLNVRNAQMTEANRREIIWKTKHKISKRDTGCPHGQPF